MIGVFGGSGFYRFLDEVEEVAVDTPYGPPSARIRIGEVDGREGGVHASSRRRALAPAAPHQLPRQRLGDAAGGGPPDRRPVGAAAPQARARPGHVRGLRPVRGPDAGREDTFYDGPQTTHVSAADPYCADLGEILVEAAREEGIEAVAGGTVVVIQGPRFSTRAESRWFAATGWDVVNMTQYPECWLARELGLCYANVSLVTDYDVGLEGMPDVEPVSADAAFEVFRREPR